MRTQDKVKRKWERLALYQVIAQLVLVVTVVQGRQLLAPTHSSEAEIPCNGHDEKTCNSHCLGLGFGTGLCSGMQCLCFRENFVDDAMFTAPINSIDFQKNDDSHGQLKLPLVPLFDEETQDFSDAKQDDEAVNPTNYDDICMTPACFQAAAKLRFNMDESVDPCSDFYSFACGGFRAKTVIPADKAEITPLSTIQDDLLDQIQVLVQDRSIDLKEPRPFSLVRTLYRSCMDEDAIESKGLEPVQAILNRLGGWPVVHWDRWNPAAGRSFHWLKLMMQFRSLGLSTDVFFGIRIVPDLKDSSKNVLSIDEPMIGLGREQWAIPPLVNAYHKYQVDVAVALGAHIDNARKEMGKVLEFERQLSNISIPRELKRDPMRFYNPVNISGLYHMFPTIPWLPLLKRMVPTDVQVELNERVILSDASQLNLLLDLVQKTEKRVLANYYLWRAAASLIPYLNRSTRDLSLNYMKVVTGQGERMKRSTECTSVVSGTMAHAVGAMYVRKHFDPSAKEKVKEIVSYVKKSFIHGLNQTEWMDGMTRMKALEKAADMLTFIGYPKELLDDNKLTEFYSDLEFTEGNYISNILRLTKAALNLSMRRLRKFNEKDDWVTWGKAAVANAAYSPIQNSIQFFAGILQGNFFNNKRPNYMNFGAIGWVVGHEITHGFDDTGRRFDKDGKLQEWWDHETQRSFLHKAQCIVGQYSQFTLPDPRSGQNMPLNGVVSQGENIADNGGMKYAYSAYKQWESQNGPEKKLPGLKYTPEQLLWISAANNWCSNHRPEVLMQKAMMAVHLPGEFRVKGTFANMDEFANDFQCPIGSAMNPIRKCKVW